MSDWRLFSCCSANQRRKEGTGSFLGGLYDPAIGVGYVFISQLIASIITLALLFREWKVLRLTFDIKTIDRITDLFDAPCCGGVWWHDQ